MLTILIILLLILLLGGGTWGYRGGYHSTAPYPYFGGLLGLIIVIILVYVLLTPHAVP